MPLVKSRKIDLIVKEEINTQVTQRAAREKEYVAEKEKAKKREEELLRKKKEEKVKYVYAKKIAKFLFFLKKKFPATHENIDLFKLPEEELRCLYKCSQKYYLLRPWTLLSIQCKLLLFIGCPCGAIVASLGCYVDGQLAGIMGAFLFIFLCAVLGNPQDRADFLLIFKDTEIESESLGHLPASSGDGVFTSSLNSQVSKDDYKKTAIPRGITKLF